MYGQVNHSVLFKDVNMPPFYSSIKNTILFKTIFCNEGKPNDKYQPTHTTQHTNYLL